MFFRDKRLIPWGLPGIGFRWFLGALFGTYTVNLKSHKIIANFLYIFWRIIGPNTNISISYLMAIALKMTSLLSS